MKPYLRFRRAVLGGPLALGSAYEIRGTSVSQCYDPAMALQKRPTSKSGTRPASFVVGRGAFEKISAVEGIHPSKASRTRAADLDRRGLSAEERRREIISAHRPKG